MIKSYLGYYSKAQTIYNIHSPFLYEFISYNLDTSKKYYPYDEIEFLRAQLQQSKEIVKLHDLGAGSKVHKDKTIEIGRIAKYALSTPYQCKILFNLVKNQGSCKVLELGTSLGIATIYLAKANKKAEIYSIEGDPTIAHIAANNFKRLKADNIKSYIGNFDELLTPLIAPWEKIDLAFIDGNHNEEATLRYFNEIKQKCHDKSILIFDDIHWSSGMKKAWNKIINDKAVHFSIDLFYFGIVLFEKRAENKQHISYIDLKYKPWKIGLFG